MYWAVFNLFEYVVKENKHRFHLVDWDRWAQTKTATSAATTTTTATVTKTYKNSNKKYYYNYNYITTTKTTATKKTATATRIAITNKNPQLTDNNQQPTPACKEHAEWKIPAPTCCKYMQISCKMEGCSSKMLQIASKMEDCSKMLQIACQMEEFSLQLLCWSISLCPIFIHTPYSLFIGPYCWWLIYLHIPIFDGQKQASWKFIHHPIRITIAVGFLQPFLLVTPMSYTSIYVCL